MPQADTCSSSGASIDTTSSSDPPPRRSNSYHRPKRSIVTTLSSAIFAASAPMSAPITRSNSSPALVLSENEMHELEEPWKYTPPPPDLTDPMLFKPVDGGIRPAIVWRYCTMRGWLTRHIPPSYSFTKSKKERYIILADRMLYAFKTDTPSAHFKEVFELTKDTNVFVTDQFTGVLYCIEITKRSEELRSWYIQCDTAELMKTWLDRLKRTVQWLREDRPGIVTLKGLGEIQTENDGLESKRNGSVDSFLSPPLSPTAQALHQHQHIPYPPSSPPHLTSSTLSSSDGSVDTRRHDSVASDQSDPAAQTVLFAQQQQSLGPYYNDYYDWQSSIPSSAPVHVSPSSSSSLSYSSATQHFHQVTHNNPLYAPYDQAPLPARRNTSPAQYTHHHHHPKHPHVAVPTPRSLPPQLPPPRSALPPPPPEYQKYYSS